jgi:hypothetical protein
VGAVTINRNRPSLDPTPYSIWVDIEAEGKERLRAIAKAGVLLGIGVQVVRNLIENSKPVRFGVSAQEVQRLYRLFKQRGLKIRISPEFPWRLDLDTA